MRNVIEYEIFIRLYTTYLMITHSQYESEKYSIFRLFCLQKKEKHVEIQSSINNEKKFERGKFLKLSW